MRTTSQAFVLFALCTMMFSVQSLPAQDAPAAAFSPAMFPEAPQPQQTDSLTLNQRFHLAMLVTFGVSAILTPAAEAGVDMALPPHHYPREWRDGAGAFGRNYGAELARHTAGGLTRFAVAAVDREDPRYYASTSNRLVPRFIHAVMFTVVDRNNSGHSMPAVSNFAGAAAAGFSGMPYEPGGFNDATHCAQRAAVELGSFGAHNLVTEFAPELYRGMRKMHLPRWMVKVEVSEDAGRP
jgi:hypothetical protein